MFDPLDPRFIADPYPVFDALRATAAVHDHPGLGMRVAVSHAVCSQVLRDRRFARVWADAEPAAEFADFNRIHAVSMLSNSAGHGRLRSALAGVFARRSLETLRPLVQARAAGLVTAFAARIARDGSADLLAEVAVPLSVGVIADWLGFPEPGRARLRPWSNAIVKMYEVAPSDAERRAAQQAAAEFAGYVGEMVAARRAAPRGDLLSDLIAAAGAGQDGLTADELVANYILLLMAGHEAGVNAIGNAVVALHGAPEQWRLLRSITADRSAPDHRLDTAADELLRYDTPNQLFERTAMVDTEISGHRFAAGDRIGVLLGAANRDPAVFTAPAALDLTRNPNPHLGLGAGIHYCLGAPLAKLELTAALTELATRLPGYRIAAEPVRSPEYVIRGYSAVAITVERSGKVINAPL